MFNLVFPDKVTPARQCIEPGDTVVGRSASCGIVVDDASVSRQHARLTATPGRCRLADLESTNGTFVNDEPITQADLADGDVVMFGDVTARVEYSAADRLAISDDRELIDSPGTIFRPISAAQPVHDAGTTFRPVGTPAAPTATAAAAVDARRLLGMMSEISRTLVRPQPLLTVLNKVVDLALNAMSADRAFLLLNDQGTTNLVPRVVRTRTGTTERATVSSTVVRRAMTERVAILAKDAQVATWLAGRNSIMDANIRSFMCVPLWNQDDVIGALYVDNPYTREFSTEDLDLFTALSEYAAVAIEQARLAASILEETKRRERLQRYHSPAVVNRILADTGEGQPMVAQERELSVLFCDVVGFTTMSEQMAPADVGRLLNRFFARMADIIFEHEGTLDKFIGDAIMAVFGAPLDQPDHAARAVRAAQAMMRSLAELNEQHPDQPLDVRIAINSGLATAGDIGSPKRREYTVLGDVVNTCARVQSGICEPGQLVITAATRHMMGDIARVRPIGLHKLKGRAAEIEAFQVV